RQVVRDCGRRGRRVRGVGAGGGRQGADRFIALLFGEGRARVHGGGEVRRGGDARQRQRTHAAAQDAGRRGGAGERGGRRLRGDDGYRAAVVPDRNGRD